MHWGEVSIITTCLRCARLSGRLLQVSTVSHPWSWVSSKALRSRRGECQRTILRFFRPDRRGGSPTLRKGDRDHVHYEKGNFPARHVAWYGSDSGPAFVGRHGPGENRVGQDSCKSSSSSRLRLSAQRPKPGGWSMD